MNTVNTAAALSVAELQSLQASGAAFELIDVRRAIARRTQGADIPGGQWRDPLDVLAWKDELPLGQRHIVYCAHGHEISQGIVATLRAMVTTPRISRAASRRGNKPARQSPPCPRPAAG